MKKTLIFWLLMIIIFISFATPGAAEETELKFGDLYYTINNDGSVYITGSADGAKIIVIPSEIYGMPVTGIAAYSQWDNIESVTIPDSVTHIGDYAFESEYYLTEIKGGNNLDNVGRYAFQATGYAKDESNYKNGVLYVGSAVVGADEDKVPAKLEILKGAKCIGANVFYDCDNITGITFPEGLKTIGEDAFFNCDNLAKINMPSSIENIGDAFGATAYIKNAANWENGILYIGDCLIEADKNISGTVSVKEGTKVIASEAFYQRHDMAEVILPEGLHSIGDKAFWNCAFTKITFPKSLKRVGYSAFGECTNLESLYVADVESYLSIDLKSSPMKYASKLYINGKRAVNIDIPETITHIPDYAFRCDSIASVKIPASVKRIGDSAFEGCIALKTIAIEGEGLESIGECAFRSCSFESINIPKSVKEIKYDAFGYCIYLKNINIPDGILEIEDKVFDNCASIEKIKLPESVERIGKYAFRECDNLAEINLPKNLKTIDNEAFYFCEKLKEISLPYGISTIGESAFCYCGIESLEIPATVKSISIGAFSCCDKLESIKINSGTESINEDAFAGCRHLRRIIIPKTVTEIENHAFSNAGSLVSIKCIVEYEGSEEDFAEIYIGSQRNEIFENANIKYNSPFAADISKNPISYTKEIENGTYCFDISVSKFADNCFVYVSIYDESDKIIAIKKAALDEMGCAKVYINKALGESYARIFVWHRAQPISHSEKEDL